MNKIKWELPLNNNITATIGSVIPVIINGKNAGTCTISKQKGKFFGDFSLIIDLPEEDKYLLEPSSTITEDGINVLNGIYILPPSTSKLVAL